jgi:hypothetical protein
VAAAVTARAALIALGLLVLAPPAPARADSVRLACSPERPVAPVGATIALRAWAASPDGAAIRYAWDATGGRLVPDGATARWTLTDMRPGRYAASVRAVAPSGAESECIVRVVVTAPAPRPRGDRPPSRESGSAALLPEQREAPGYGLYSYLLLGAPPAAASRARCLEAIEAYWSLVPEIQHLERYVPRAELNVIHLPLTEAPGPAPSAEWLLAHYDYARARSLLRRLDSQRRDGPYLVSVLRPLGEAPPHASGARHLFQDLSAVPSHLVREWVKEFVNQAAQERFWEERTAAGLVLRLRLTLGVLSLGLPEVRQAVDTWIAWIQ